MKFPTVLHENYINYIREYAEKNKIKVLLTGSLATGNATKYSDVDLIILDSRFNIIRNMIMQYGNIAMINETENPKGIIIVIYENGIAVDIDLREKIVLDEYNEAVHINNIDKSVISKSINRISLSGIRCYMDNSEWYKTLRLFHRSAIKSLSNNNIIGERILEEIRESLESMLGKKIKWNYTYKEDFMIAFEIAKRNYKVSNVFIKIIHDLVEFL